MALATLSVLVSGCGTSGTAPLADGGSSGAHAPESGIAGPLSISVDGEASEWQDVVPVWEEGGAPGPGDLAVLQRSGGGADVANRLGTGIEQRPIAVGLRTAQPGNARMAWT
jgi:hypothetical protein